MPRTHEPVPIGPIRGWFARSEYIAPPLGYLETCTDCVFFDPGIPIGTSQSGRGTIFSRPPHEIDGAALPANVVADGGPVRYHKYRKITDTQDHWLILTANGRFFDTGSATPNTPILTLTAATAPDFSAITIGQRIIFSPHNREQGISGEFTYIYERGVTATARKLAGARPSGTFTVAVSATAGNTEPGLHMLAIAFEYDTGFITKPALYQQLQAPAGARMAIDLPIIPTGPAGVTARRILMSRIIKNFDGNNEHPELFFALKIADNTTTTLTNAINLYDSQLIQPADYLKDNLEEVAAMLCFAYHDKCLVCSGEASSKSTVRVSKGGDYETFDATDGFVLCAPLEGDGVRNLKSARGSLYMFKRARTFSTRNNGGSPSTWSVDIVDTGLGAEVFSVAEVGDSIIGSINNTFLIANQSGYWYFDNGFIDLLSWAIQREWIRNVDLTAINALEALYLPMLGVGAVFMPPNTGVGRVSGNALFFYDIRDGITKENAKWSRWAIPAEGSSGLWAGMHSSRGTDGWERFHFVQGLYNFFHSIRFTNIIYSTAKDNTWSPKITFRLHSAVGTINNWSHVRFLFSRDPQFQDSTSIILDAGPSYENPLLITRPLVKPKGFILEKLGIMTDMIDISVSTIDDLTYFALLTLWVYTKPVGEDKPR